MKHEIDQEQVQALARVVIKASAALTTGLHSGVRQLVRSRALSAAVAYHASQNDFRSVNQVIATADKFETYILNGRRV